MKINLIIIHKVKKNKQTMVIIHQNSIKYDWLKIYKQA